MKPDTHFVDGQQEVCERCGSTYKVGMWHGMLTCKWCFDEYIRVVSQ